MKGISFKEAFFFWLKLGFISFGGPAGQIAIMHEYLVVKKKWIEESKFLHALNYCMLLPGPEAQQLATYMGWLMHGVMGGITAGLLFILPSVFIMLALSIAYVTFGSTNWMIGLFLGIKAVVIAIVILALIKISGKALKTKEHYTIALLSLLSLTVANLSYPLLILIVIVGALAYFYFTKQEKYTATKLDEVFSYIIFKRTFLSIALTLILWAVPFLLLNNWEKFWGALALFFTQSALVTFGGAYSVLMYVSQHAVENLHWLSRGEMIDGLAFGETTPGPLIMVLTYVGFMAAYNTFGASIFAGTIGLLITTYFTFLPSFAFILIGAPIVESTQQNKLIKHVLEYITAAVVGVIANLSLFLVQSVLFKDGNTFYDPKQWLTVLWIAVSLFALKKFSVNIGLWMLLSGLAGIVMQKLIA